MHLSHLRGYLLHPPANITCLDPHCEAASSRVLDILDRLSCDIFLVWTPVMSHPVWVIHNQPRHIEIKYENCQFFGSHGRVHWGKQEISGRRRGEIRRPERTLKWYPTYHFEHLSGGDTGALYFYIIILLLGVMTGSIIAYCFNLYVILYPEALLTNWGTLNE